MLSLGEWRSEIDDFHFNCLVGRSSIPILTPGGNKNGLIYLQLNPSSPLCIQILIPISISILIPVMNQMVQRIWSFRFLFQSILISISITNQTLPWSNRMEVAFQMLWSRVQHLLTHIDQQVISSHSFDSNLIYFIMLNS